MTDRNEQRAGSNLLRPRDPPTRPPLGPAVGASADPSADRRPPDLSASADGEQFGVRE